MHIILLIFFLLYGILVISNVKNRCTSAIRVHCCDSSGITPILSVLDLYVKMCLLNSHHSCNLAKSKYCQLSASMHFEVCISTCQTNDVITQTQQPLLCILFSKLLHSIFQTVHTLTNRHVCGECS
jgi:hypothetical protein